MQTVETNPTGNVVILKHRPLYQIASDVYADWKKVNYAAAPYLEAMSDLQSIDDKYYLDSARSIVLYFLSNASTWRGETAKRIKAELKTISNM